MATEFDNTNLNNNQNNMNKKPEGFETFFDDSVNSGFKFKDFVFLVLRNLPWFLIFSLIGGVIAFYKVRGEDRIYASSASMLIKTQSSGGSETFRGSSTLNAIQGAGPIVSTINNEIMIMKSQTIMENTVRRLNLNTMYYYTTKVSKRNMVLYKDAPIEVVFPGMDEQAWASFSVKPVYSCHGGEPKRYCDIACRKDCGETYLALQGLYEYVHHSDPCSPFFGGELISWACWCGESQ